VPLKILLIESQSAGSFSMKSELLDRGYEVTIAHGPRKAISCATADWPDLIVVNGCAGSLNVSEICQALDETEFDFPRLIVSHDEVHNHAPVNTYLPAPYTPRQLSYRIKKALGDQSQRFLRVGDVTLDGFKRQVKRNDRVVYLTPKEFKLLRLLMEHAGEVLNRRTIMKEVWETDFLDDTRTLDVHIRWIRKKLEDDPSHPRYIITVRGVGYRFAPQGT